MVRNSAVIQGYGGSSRPAGVHNRRLGPPTTGVRPPIAAGRIYSAQPAALRSDVESMLDAIHVDDAEPLGPAFLVPHGAYEVSGGVAGAVYARLRAHAPSIQRVVVLGPRHGEMAARSAVPWVAEWETPLGRTRIDPETTGMLLADGHVTADDAAHRGEHALEAQLPFIQVAVPDAMIIPILVGPVAPEDVVVTLSALTDSPGTVIVGTTDLGGTRAADRTLVSILDMAAERIGSRDACGVHALRGLIRWANHRSLRARLLARDGDHAACVFDARPEEGGIGTHS